jgi:hypothetical protein
MLDQRDGPGELGAGVGRFDGKVVGVQHAVQESGVFAQERGVGLGHELGAVSLVVVVAGVVGMDALGDLAEEGFEVGFRVQGGGFRGCCIGCARCGSLHYGGTLLRSR